MMEETERVTPQEGQGIPVIFLKRHARISPVEPMSSLRNTQQYPANESARMRKYNFLRVTEAKPPATISDN